MTRNLHRIIFVVLILYFLDDASSTESQCHLDCSQNSNPTLRVITTSHKDEFEISRLTRRYHSIASSKILTEVVFWSKLESSCYLQTNDTVSKHTLESWLLSEMDSSIRAISHELSKYFISADIATSSFNASITQYNISIHATLQVTISMEHINDSEIELSKFLQQAVMEKAVTVQNAISKESTSANNSTKGISCCREWSIIKSSQEKHYKTRSCAFNGTFETEFVQSCQLGCSLFFSSSTKPMYVTECFDSCKSIYLYHASFNENDHAAKLHCMNGCLLALERCQPGYFCIQPQTTDPILLDSTVSNDNTGYMAPCPPGTYRTESYDSVNACQLCPPGRYRDDVMGTSFDSCKKCPINTFANHAGSSSVSDCLPCPLGTFTNEMGSSVCECITPDACDMATVQI